MELMVRFALLLCLGAAACSSPTTPSPGMLTPSPRLPPAALVLTGTWEGTYRISHAEPSNCGNLSGCPANPTLTLTLAQSGDALSGILQLLGIRFAVKGRVNATTEVTLFSDPEPVNITCPGRPIASGENRLDQWSTRLVAGKSLVGTFTAQEFSIFNVGGTNLCPAGTIRIVAEDVRLTRVTAP